MRHIPVLLCCVLLACRAAAADTVTVAFGSCLRQWKPAPILDAVRALKPDVFVFAGDNVYTDNGPYRFEAEPGRIALAYAELGARPEFAALRESTRLLATWDDHDYGRNNAGAEYPWKAEAREQFLAFFAVPDDSPLRRRTGIYSAHRLGPADRQVDVVLLDTRTFRGPLQEDRSDTQCPGSRLVPTTDTSATVLGEAQWRWLTARLQQPAALRLIVSSIQVIPDQHCFEKWGNFPHERARLLGLIADSGVRTVILSGDRHLGEISRLPGRADAPPLYEITASGLNSAGAGAGEINRYRVTGDNVREDHFGTVRFSPDTPATVELTLSDAAGHTLQRYTLDHASWSPREPAETSLPYR